MGILQMITVLFASWLSLSHAHPTLDINVNNKTNALAKRGYTDGEGQYINTDSVHHYASGVKCWTDYFLVSQDAVYGEWYPASSKVYCTGTDVCHVDTMVGRQNCETTTLEISVGISNDLFNIGVSAGYQVQKCNSADDTTSCSWNDGQCHIIWAQQQYLRQEGYMRRRCHDKGKDHTAWMKEYEKRSPTNFVHHGCGSKCSDSA